MAQEHGIRIVIDRFARLSRLNDSILTTRKNKTFREFGRWGVIC